MSYNVQKVTSRNLESFMRLVPSKAFRYCYNRAWRFKRIGRLIQIVLHRVSILGNVYNRLLLLKSLPDRDIEVSFDGQRILVHNPRRNVIGQSIFLTGMWEPEVTVYICSRIKRDMIILDVGADIGYYSLLFAKRVGDGGRVIAFEPIPEARRTLEHNVRLNGYQNVTICDYGLYDKNGEFILEGPLDISRINPVEKETRGDSLKIRTRTFDECRTELGISKVDLVKIDVEGAEMNVLKGMENSIKESRPALMVEVHPMHLDLFGHRADDLIDYLRNMDYSVYPVDKMSLCVKRENVTIFCTPGAQRFN